MPDQTNCSSGQYFCNDRQKCMPIPKGHKVLKDGELVKEVAPPGWGHTKAEKEKTKPDKPKSKIGGSAAAFKRALDDGRFKGLPGDKTKKEKTASMFKLMWSMKKKGAKPHYKPGTDEKKKKYQEEETSTMPNVSKKDRGAIKKRAKNLFKRDLTGEHDSVNEEIISEKDLNAKERRALPDKDFALPGKGEGPQGKQAGSYPIPDKKHARSALSLVSQHGTPEEKAKVRAKVAKKFPGIQQEEEVKEGTSIIQGRTSKKKVSYRGATADHKRDKDGNIEASYYGKKEKSKKHTDAVRKFDNYQKLQAEISARDAARKKHNQEYAASKRANEEVIYEKLSSRDAKKLDKASALSQSNDPKDQDRARARQTEVDYKDLMRQIQSKKKKSSKSPMNEKYGDSFDTPKQKAKDAAKKKENTDRDLRMKHGKKWRDFTKDALDSKNKERNRLKTGEVKKLVDGKWVSNKS